MTKGFYQHITSRSTVIQVFHVEHVGGHLKVLVKWWNVSYGRPYDMGIKERLMIPVEQEGDWRRVPNIDVGNCQR